MSGKSLVATARRALGACQLRDERRLRRRLDRLTGRGRRGRPVDAGDRPGNEEALAALVAEIEQSAAVTRARRNLSSSFDFDERLPVAARRDEIRAAVEAHQVVVVAGETGSGKTTQLPKICAQAGRGIRGRIGHTQPRRIAARGVASRLAEELRTPLGGRVGYQVRFHESVAPESQMKVMTDGILLAETRRDRLLLDYDTLIIDEAHERSLNVDFLLGYLKRLLARRSDLKLIITSATIDVERFSKHFDDAPVIEVAGRTYPVEIRYAPPADDDPAPLAIERAWRSVAGKGGDTLVFLPGERDIREAALHLRRALPGSVEVLPLYARLGLKDQQKIFHPGGAQRIVLATNVAETSLTVPRIRFVIDSGTARISRYSARSAIQRLPIEPVSQASAQQRAGRCGRIAEGICVRLYDEAEFLDRPEFTDPEIRRTNLSQVILRMLDLELGAVDEFPFLEPPDVRQVNDGYRTLADIGAIDDKRGLTQRGRHLAHLPVDPRLGRILLAGAEAGCLTEALVIVSALSIQDPRERPADKQQAADTAQEQFQVAGSDMLSLVKLWNEFEDQRQALGSSQLRKYCERHFLSWLRMREWRDIHHQLRLSVRELKLSENREPAKPDAVHRAVLAGLVPQVAQAHEGHAYRLPRGNSAWIFPGSAAFEKRPAWLVAGEMAETTRLYLRSVAPIRPEWVEQVAPHLVRRTHDDAHWRKKQGAVFARERVSLQGLTLIENRLVDFSSLDPATARAIFIESALVGGALGANPGFLTANRTLIERVRDLEAKVRRRDILVDDTVLAEFYADRLPEDIASRAGLMHWCRRKSNADRLVLTEAEVMRRLADEVTQEAFPDAMQVGGESAPVTYAYEPGAATDGVTVDVSLAGLADLDEPALDWLVPGMLRERATALVKGLPRQLRRRFVPVPATIDAFFEWLPPDARNGDEGGLADWLARFLSQRSDTAVSPEALTTGELPEHLRIQVRVVDPAGKTLSVGRNLPELRRAVLSDVDATLATADAAVQTGITAWNFGNLPERTTVQSGKREVAAWPALVDHQDSVAIEPQSTAGRAAELNRWGLARLASLVQKDASRYLQKQLFSSQADVGRLGGVLDRTGLVDDIVLLTFDLACFEGRETPRSEADFNACLSAGRADVVPLAQDIERTIAETLDLRRDLFGQFAAVNPARAAVEESIRNHVDQLLASHFVRRAGRWVLEYPRYLRAATLRWEKLHGKLDQDAERDRELADEALRIEAAAAQAAPGSPRATALDAYRWLVEEYRVACFAQQLKTRVPVSAKRLRRAWDDVMAQRPD